MYTVTCICTAQCPITKTGASSSQEPVVGSKQKPVLYVLLCHNNGEPVNQKYSQEEEGWAEAGRGAAATELLESSFRGENSGELSSSSSSLGWSRKYM